MDDLLKDAIADAKAVRETALANAKIALEEAFTPRLQSMLSKKIQSEMEDSDEEMDAEEMRDSEEEMDKDEAEHEEMRNSDEIEHEEEMDAEEMRDSEEAMHDKDEAEHEEMRDSEEEMEEEMKDKDEEDAEEMRETEDAEEEDAEEEDKMDEAEDAEEDDELDLESVLAELEKDLDDEDKVDEMEDKDEEEKVDEVEDKDEDEKVDENDVSSEIGKSDNKVAPAAGDSSKVGQGPESEGSDKKAGDELSDHETVDDLVEVEDKDEEDLDLDEVLRALTEEDKEEEDAEENEKLKSEIKEHRKVIHFMRSKLNEVNLLNAKLLFSNKLFRAFGLNNNQKLKVVETFDRTKNLREVKLVYATLAESFKRPGKRLSESVRKGSSSKPVRSTKPVKEVLSEGAEMRNRFKKLANIL